VAGMLMDVEFAVRLELEEGAVVAI
jgi:hypothetical protein